MYRMSGALLLIIAAAFLGMGMRTIARRQISALNEALSILRHIRRKIELFNTPSDALLMDYAGRDGRGITEKQLEQLYVALGTEGETLRTFFVQLGSGYKTDTLRLCDYTSSVLEERLKKAENELPARVKLYAAMPLLFVFSLIVLFL